MTGAAAARSAATALVISPRLQNLQHKMLTALNDNRISVANQVLDQFKQVMKHDAPEYYELIKNDSFPIVEPAKKQSKEDVAKKSKK